MNFKSLFNWAYRKDTKPFFSVVISTFNRGPGIEHTIQSALNQTFRDFELFVIGDGCTDDTAEGVLKFKDPRLTWINLRQNSGTQSAPNNFAIERALGQYIAYLGHDDIWAPHHLSTLYETIIATQADYVVSGTIYYGPPGSDSYHVTGLFSDMARAETEFFPPTSIAHRKQLALDIGLWRKATTIRAPIDFDFQSRCFAQGAIFAPTGLVTALKFAAGHRYRFYKNPVANEQKAMLANLAREERFIERELARILYQELRYGDVNLMAGTDFSKYAPGELHAKMRNIRGVSNDRALKTVRETSRFDLAGTDAGVGDGPIGLDWHRLERPEQIGSFRWSGPSPVSKWFLPIHVARPFRVRAHIITVLDERLIQNIRIEINNVALDVGVDSTEQGTWLVTSTEIDPSKLGPTHGMELLFRLDKTIRVCDVTESNDTRKVGIALNWIEISVIA